MKDALGEDTVLYKPPIHLEIQGDIALLIDPENPNWMATDARGAEILSYLNGRRTIGEVVIKYAEKHKIEPSKAWHHCFTLLKDAYRCGFASPEPYSYEEYKGRHRALKLEKLQELWLHLTNKCNLACRHCLVDSSPRAGRGIPARSWGKIIGEALELGAERFYITGGEPFMRTDLPEILGSIREGAPREIVILTNGTLLDGNLRMLSKHGENLMLQISLDGSKPEINDAIRGRGSFDAALEGIKKAADTGFPPTIATTLLKSNLGDVGNITRLASELDAAYHHLFLPYPRGRVSRGEIPSVGELLHAFKEAMAAGEETGIKVDNFEFLKHRVAGGRGVKTDLSNAAWSSLCIYHDGHAYPTAALAGVKSLDMGSALEGSLEKAWRTSRVARVLRRATVKGKENCPACYLRYICGGGDVEHAYLYNAPKGFQGHDPFCGVHRELLREAMFAVARERRSLVNRAYDAPVVFFSMLEDAAQDKGTVTTSRSSCVYFLEVEKARKTVRDFYAKAAEKPVAELCCPGGYSPEDTSHIPREVLEIAYGCGSPLEWAGIKEGEVVVDLGSGGGIDCFVAAKKVGARGKVYGIDMTEEMLRKAEQNRLKVAENLGYDVVEFRKGYLEELPLPSACADVVISNCVINLSPDKKRVFSEIWRVLKNHGRAVISDTLSEEQVPARMRANPRLWGECVSGALTEEEFLAYMERAGFHGVAVLKKTPWREVEGRRFYSAVIRGYKLEKSRDCRYRGQRAVYKGPFKAVVDEEGHLFPRGEAVEVCTDTAAKLKKPPYSASFEVLEPGSKGREYRCCDSGPC